MNLKTYKSTPIQNDTKVDANKDLKKELADLKSMVKSIQRQSMESNYPEQFLPIIEFLKRQELNEELITAISDELFAHYQKLNSEVSQKELWQLVERFLRTKLEGLKIRGAYLRQEIYQCSWSYRSWKDNNNCENSCSLCS